MTKETITTHEQEFNVEKIGLFGGYARGEEREDSDVDLLVKMPPKLFDMIKLKQQTENDLHKKVDLIREHKYIKPFLLEMILKDITYAR